MGFFEGATGVVDSARSLISSGPVSALSNISDAIGSIFKVKSGKKLPLPNPLFAYATYDYVISIGCLTVNEINNPDTTYMAGKRIPLICKSANADPNNRVKTPYGQFDFFVNNLELTSCIGLDMGQTTNVTNITFNVTEPYSMGMFVIACQTVAQRLGWENFREAPFCLTIDFRGNTETGKLSNIPGTRRIIPFYFQDIIMTANEKGANYSCTAQVWVQSGLTDSYKNFTTNVSVKGTTVQETLQTGEKSLQAVINKRFKDTAKAAGAPVPDEILILFPQDTATGSTSASSATPSEDKSGATASTKDPISSTNLMEKLGVSRSTKNQTLVQKEGDCNALGKASLGFDEGRKADTPFGKDNAVYDAEKKVNVRANNSVDPKESEMKFRQDTDIPNAINQVLLQSSFPGQTLDASKLSPEGMRGWWRIDIQSYVIPTTENYKVTGTQPRLIVYRVVPYDVHASKMLPPGASPPGINNLVKQAVKRYDYLYTGKNVDVLKFEIKIAAGFMNVMGADGLQKSQDVKQAAQTGGVADEQAKVNPAGSGNYPEKGASTGITKYIGTLTGTDKGGGGGQEDAGTRAGRIFMDAITVGTDMYDLDLTIIGDPYFIVQSGTGNYTATQTEYSNLNADGSVNYQNGEVDILVNFRTPIDINQSTGLYKFAGGKSAPIIQYSGLYCVTEVKSKFADGQFTQVLTGFRRPAQENMAAPQPGQTFNVSKAAVDKSDPYGTGTNS